MRVIFASFCSLTDGENLTKGNLHTMSKIAERMYVREDHKVRSLCVVRNISRIIEI